MTARTDGLPGFPAKAAGVRLAGSQALPPHQVVLRMRGNDISLSCACLRIRRPGRPGQGFIESRTRFPAAEAVAAWRDWHEREGIPL